MADVSGEPLKPCPFCGGEACIERDDRHGRPFVMCERCGAEGPSAGGLIGAAVRAWNRRTEPT